MTSLEKRKRSAVLALLTPRSEIQVSPDPVTMPADLKLSISTKKMPVKIPAL